jgi:taurine--2-oxoglutarate transaminase
MAQKVAGRMMSQGVFVYTGVVSHLIISPPLIITKDQLDQSLEVLDDALAVADGETDEKTVNA